MRTLTIVATVLMAFLLAADAHDHDNPGLDDWYKSLANENGGYCCDGSDAYSVNDPDWEVTADPEKPYRVKVDGFPDWILVEKGSVVKGANKAGVAKVWPVFVQGKPLIRCFLPGSGA